MLLEHSVLKIIPECLEERGCPGYLAAHRFQDYIQANWAETLSWMDHHDFFAHLKIWDKVTA